MLKNENKKDNLHPNKCYQSLNNIQKILTVSRTFFSDIANAGGTVAFKFYNLKST